VSLQRLGLSCVLFDSLFVVVLCHLFFCELVFFCELEEKWLIFAALH